jgi:nitrilase
VPRVAVIQRPPVFLDRAATLDQAVASLGEAAANGARLAVFPEALVPGYPAWMWRLRPGPDMALTERIHARLRANSVSLAADELSPLREAARRHELTVVCGLHERDEALGGGTLYNTVVTIGADGALLNRHRKLMPTNPERMVWGCGDASGLRTVPTACGRIGALICWESYMPLARYALYAQGLDVYVTPTYDSGERAVATMQHIAREGGCWRATSRMRFRGKASSFATPTSGSTRATRSWSRRAARSSPGRCTKSARSCTPRSTSSASAWRAAAWTSSAITRGPIFSSCA